MKKHTVRLSTEERKTLTKKIDGDVEAHLVAFSCSEPPPSRQIRSHAILP